MSPTVTFWDVLWSLGNLEVLGKWLNLTSKSFLTLLAGEEEEEEEEEETVEPDAPPLGNGRIKTT